MDSNVNNIQDDGLPIEKIKFHSTEKHNIIAYYAKMFSTGMKKWQNRVYIDLFAGSGYSKVKGENEIRLGSPLIALAVKDKFSHYIFCEKDEEKINALRSRVERMNPNENVCFIQGDVNFNIDQVLWKIPKFSSSNNGISFCVVDPYAASTLNFNSINKLASNIFVDFLVLIPTHMEFNLFQKDFLYGSRKQDLNNFLGNDDWYEKWLEIQYKPSSNFGDFILESFCDEMRKLGFKTEGLKNAKPILHADKNYTLYYLCFFSKHDLGLVFWKKCLKGTRPQTYFEFYDET